MLISQRRKRNHIGRISDRAGLRKGQSGPSIPPHSLLKTLCQKNVCVSVTLVGIVLSMSCHVLVL